MCLCVSWSVSYNFSFLNPFKGTPYFPSSSHINHNCQKQSYSIDYFVSANYCQRRLGHSKMFQFCFDQNISGRSINELNLSEILRRDKNTDALSQKRQETLHTPGVTIEVILEDLAQLLRLGDVLGHALLHRGPPGLVRVSLHAAQQNTWQRTSAPISAWNGSITS